METAPEPPKTTDTASEPVSRSKYAVPKWTSMLWRMSNDLEDDTLEEVLGRYNAGANSGEDARDEEGEGVDKWKHRFLDTMGQGQDELKTARRLRDVLEEMNLHSKFEPLAEKVDDYIRHETQFRNNFVNEVFVGREEALELIYEKFNIPGGICGINIWGLGGQGKSALAKNVCLKMMQERWTVVKVDLRDVTRVVQVAKQVLVGSRELCPQHDDRRELMDLTRQMLTHVTTNSLYFLDNCDKLMDSDKSGLVRFLEMGFVCAKTTNKVRFLLTTRQKLTVNKEEFSQGRTCKFTHGPRSRLPELAEFQLHALTEPEAVQLFKTVTEQDDVDDRLVLEIVTACGCSPHAITIAASLVKDGRFSTERLCAHLKLDARNVTKALHMSDLIRDAIGSLEPELQKALVKLSVFPNTQFNLQAACEVLDIPSSEKKEAKDVLHELHVKHMVECENKLSSLSKHTSNKKLCFSLHPLVHRYLCEWRKPADLEHAFNDGVRSFMELYEKRIGQVVNKMNTKGLKGAEMFQEHKRHIDQYYDILHDKHELLNPYPRKVESKQVLAMKRVSDLTDLMISDVKKRRLFQSEAERARRAGCDDMYVFWRVEEADVLLMLHDKPGMARDILDDLTNGKFAALRGLHADTFYRPIIHALFHKVKGLVLWKLVSHDPALRHLALALHFYKKRESRVYDPLVARVHCFMGQVYLDKDDLDNAERSFTAGFQLLTGRDPMAQTDAPSPGSCPSGLGDRNQRAGVQVDAPVYYAHFGKIQLKRAFIDPANKEKFLDKAQELLEEGMALDKQLKLDRLDNYCLKQKLLADVFTEKALLDEALKFAEDALLHRREIIQPPHFKYVESVYQVARLYYLKGNYLKQNDKPDEARGAWTKSLVHFGKLKDRYLVNGSIAADHPLVVKIRTDHLEVTRLTQTTSDIKKMATFYKDHYLVDGSVGADHPLVVNIRADHLDVTRLTHNPHDLKKLAKFYKDLAAGCYKSSATATLTRFKEMLWTPMEMVKKAFGSGGEEFGEHDHILEQYEVDARSQEDQMVRDAMEGEGGGPDAGRRDSGMGHSSGGSGGESSLSSTGSVTSQLARMRMEKSLSLEDNVFTASTEAAPSAKPDKKRQKTINE